MLVAVSEHPAFDTNGTQNPVLFMVSNSLPLAMNHGHFTHHGDSLVCPDDPVLGLDL